MLTQMHIVILTLRLSAMFGGSKSLRNWLLVLLGWQIVAEITIVQTAVVNQHGEWGYRRVQLALTRTIKLYYSMAAHRTASPGKTQSDGLRLILFQCWFSKPVFAPLQSSSRFRLQSHITAPQG